MMGGRRLPYQRLKAGCTKPDMRYTKNMANPFQFKNQVVIAPISIIFTVALLLGLYFFYSIREIVTLLFLAFILMVAVNPAVTFLQNRARFPRALATVVMFLIVLLALGILVGLVVPPLTQQLYQLVKVVNIPFVQREIANLNFTLSEIGNLAERVGSSLSVVLPIITSTFSGIFTFFTLIVMSVYLTLDRPNLHKKVGWFSRNPSHYALAKKFLDSLEEQLGSWVRGQITLMVVVGVITYIGLLLLSVPYALPLAVLAGLLEIIPNLGPTIAAVPAVILAYIALGPVMAGVVALFYIIVQQAENNIIVPKIMRDNVDVNPLIAITTILIGLKLGGVTGALLAVPVYIVVRTVYSMWYHHQTPTTEV